MAAWSDVGVAAVGAAGGIFAALAGVKAQAQIAARGRHEDRADVERREGEAERRDRLDRVADVLGPIQTLLIDLLPARALMNLPDLATLRADRTGRWQPLRDRWEVLIVKEPDADTRAAMRQLEVAIENLYSRLGLAVNPNAQLRTDGRTWYDDAVDHHDEAGRLAEEIAADLHQRGNIGATRPAEISRDADATSEADPAE